jgi:hypothetical protein
MLDSLRGRGYKICYEAEEADISVVLSGKFENPLALSGKRILVFARGQWFPQHGFQQIWHRLLAEYYDDMVDVAQTSRKEAIKKIEDCIAKYNGQAA